MISKFDEKDQRNEATLDSAFVINQIAKLNSSKSYLEIGISEGTTFVQVSVEDKTGVDPYPKIEPDVCARLNVQVLKSDDFFVRNKKTFDLIFLDGLHTADQTAKDFANSVLCSTLKTIWLIDDVFPDSCASSARSLAQYRAVRAVEFLTGRNSRPVGWQGDVFRIIANVHLVDKWFVHWTICEPGFRMQSVVVWNVQNVNAANFEEVKRSIGKELEVFKSSIQVNIDDKTPGIFGVQKYLGRNNKDIGQPTDHRAVPIWYKAKPFDEVISQVALSGFP